MGENQRPVSGADRARGYTQQETARGYPQSAENATSPRMRLINFKPLSKGALRGFANVELPIGLVIEDCAVLVSNGRAWASLPAKPVLDREGRHVKPDGTKGQYAAILKWKDRQLADKWSDAVVALVRAAHPDALDGGGR